MSGQLSGSVKTESKACSTIVSLPAKCWRCAPTYTLSSFLFNIVQKLLAKATLQERQVKDIYIVMKKIKLFLCMDTIIIYIENPKNPHTQKCINYKNFHINPIRYEKVLQQSYWTKYQHKNQSYFYVLAQI